MPAPSITCPDCGRPVGYWEVHCRCGHFLGFPNQREALAERDVLGRRYDLARDDATRRGVAHLLGKLEALVAQSLPVICMPFATCDDILRAGKYRNYHERVESGERNPAGAQDHADRSMVGDRLFPNYSKHIYYAALSPAGRGLSSYGPVAMRWQVTPVYLGRRASLLEENSFTFYDHHGLGRRGASVPLGYRSVWADRAMLAAAKLTSRLTTATSESALPGVMMTAGKTRPDDDFIEISIYSDGGVDTEDVDMVTIQLPATTPEEAHRRDLVREVCASRGIAFVE